MKRRFQLPKPKLHPHSELLKFNQRLMQGETFTLVRFSDGECEIIEGNKLEISDQGVTWSAGKSKFQYPAYDYKFFDPNSQQKLRADLIASASFSSTTYFKGIPTRHNSTPQSTQTLFDLNQRSTRGLTFADIFMNSNYRMFIETTLPILKARNRVALIGNFRMSPENVDPNWVHHKIGDNAFLDHEEVVAGAIKFIESLEQGSVVLSSASSLSNIIGHLAHDQNLPVTFVDIGTTLHPFMGLADSRREYQSQLSPWTITTARTKLGYALSRSSKIRW